MEKSTVLGIALLGSMTLNYFLWRETQQEDAVPVEEPECFVTRGFESQKDISKDESNIFMEEFNRTLTDPDSIRGGIITRSAFDEMLCTNECNAISYNFARDPDGRTGPGGNGIFVIFSGLNVTVDPETGRIIEYKDLGIKRYITSHWCPPTCNPFL